MLQLNGKKTLVTGGTAGIGKEIAATFARQGAHVAIFGTNAERAMETISYLETCRVNSDQKFVYRLVDVASTASAQENVQSLWQSGLL